VANIGGIDHGIASSELFGHVKGAFTDALQDREGLFKAADGGTLFLDEIGNLPMSMQVKLLSVIENRRITPVGSNESQPIEVRLICATNMPVSEMVAQKKFREDLFYRLNVIEFTVPPLRDRPSEIKPLALAILAALNASLPDPGKHFTDKAIQKLLGHNWPGNVRELQNVIQRAAIFCDGESIDTGDIEFSSPTIATAAPATELKTIEAMERDMIQKALDKTDNNKTKAADILGISVRTLRNKLAEYRQQDGLSEDERE